MAAIVVSNISLSTAKSSLSKYFSSPENGGGQIAYVLYPLGTDFTRAVINFTNPVVCETICSLTHKLDGKFLRVRLQPKQAYSSCTAEVDPSILAGLKDVHKTCKELEDEFGIMTYFSEDGCLTFQGTMLQIQSAQSKLEQIYNAEQTEFNQELGKFVYDGITTPRESRYYRSPLSNGEKCLQSLPAMHFKSSGDTADKFVPGKSLDSSHAVDEMFAETNSKSRPKVTRNASSGKSSNHESFSRSLSDDSASKTKDSKRREHTKPDMQMQVDPYVLKYIRKFYRAKIVKIEHSNKVEFRYLKGDGLSVVKIAPRSEMEEADADNAQRDFVSLYQSTFYAVVQDTVNIGDKDVSKEESDSVVRAVKQAFPDDVAAITGADGEVTLVGPWRRTAAASEFIRQKLGLKDSPPARSAALVQPEISADVNAVSHARESPRSVSSVQATGSIKTLDKDNDREEIDFDETKPMQLDTLQTASSREKHHAAAGTELATLPIRSPAAESQHYTSNPQSAIKASLMDDLMSGSAYSDHVDIQYSTDQGLKVQTTTNNIANVTADVIVSASNVTLNPISGVAKAIADQGGQEFVDACTELIHAEGLLKPTQVVSVPASGRLPCSHVIHAVGPFWRDYRDTDRCASDLRKTFLNTLRHADKVLQASSIAIPAISTGVYGVPDDVCARSLFEAIQVFSLSKSKSSSLSKVIVVNYNNEATALFSTIFTQLREAGHFMTEPLPGGYDSDISSGGAASQQNVSKRKVHKQPKQAASESDGEMSEYKRVPSDPLDLAAIEERYHKQVDVDARSDHSLGSVARYAPSDHPDEPLMNMSASSVGSIARYPPSDHADDALSQRSFNSLGSLVRQTSDRPDDVLSHRSVSSGASLARYAASDRPDEPWSGGEDSSHQRYMSFEDAGSLKTSAQDLAQVDVMLDELQQLELTHQSSAFEKHDDDDDDRTPVITPRSSTHSHHSAASQERHDTSKLTSSLQRSLDQMTPPLSFSQSHFQPITASSSSLSDSLTRGSQKNTLDDLSILSVTDQGNYTGQMTSEVNRKISLPESEIPGVIVVTFNFENIIDKSKTLEDIAYIPNSEEGRHLLRLMKAAFDAQQLVWVESGCLVWADVEHKTQITGGVAGNGFPDEDYVLRATEQLQAKGFN